MNLNQFYRYYQNAYNRNLDHVQIRFIMMQVCSALDYLHSLNIMHRDIKPENIMIDPTTLSIKIIDFGFAKKFNEDPLTGYMVTRWYRPLEVVIGLKYDEKIDVFAAAVIYLELVQGKQIFQSLSNMDQMNKLLTICGYPAKNTRQYDTLEKLGIQNNFNPPTISYQISKLPQITREVMTAMLSNCSNERPPIRSLLQILVNSQPMPALLRPPVPTQGKRRARSTTGLTLVKHFSKEKRMPIRSLGGGNGLID